MEGSPVITHPVVSSPDEHPHYLGWVIACALLATTTLIFLLLWIFSHASQQNPTPPPGVCFGPFGVESDIDANPLSACGTDRTDPCIFAVNTLQAAEDQCNTLQSVCNAFTFNESTATMKIVQPTNTFVAMGTNLFVRQSG